jgi:hypothetical protein
MGELCQLDRCWQDVVREFICSKRSAEEDEPVEVQAYFTDKKQKCAVNGDRPAFGLLANAIDIINVDAEPLPFVRGGR